MCAAGSKFHRRIDEPTAERLDTAEDTRGIKDTAKAELESQRDDRSAVVRETEDASEIVKRSREALTPSGEVPDAVRQLTGLHP